MSPPQLPATLPPARFNSHLTQLLKFAPKLRKSLFLLELAVIS
jgi:hypothetical protein